jgi:hypothetical protein
MNPWGKNSHFAFARFDRTGRRSFFLSFLRLLLVAAFLFSIPGSGTPPGIGRLGPGRMGDAPPLILWAWERPEELLFIDPRQVGVAFLAATCRLVGGEVHLAPRLQPLRIPRGTFLETVVRVEEDRRRPPDLSTGQCAKLVDGILNATSPFGARALQVDFDAAASRRSFYLHAIRGLRARLPERTALSITALASWCLQDRWLGNTPIDEAVPMLFRMGADGALVRRRLREGGDFAEPSSRKSVGISTDEELLDFPPGRRVYIFNPKPWSSESLRKIMENLRRCAPRFPS